MADLKAMFGKKPQPESPKDVDVSAATSPSSVADAGTPSPVKRNPFARVAKVQPDKLDGAPAGSETPREAPTLNGADTGGAGRDTGGVESGGDEPSGAAGSSGAATGDDPSAKPRLAGFRFSPRPAGASPDSGGVSGGPISSLDDLNESQDEGSPPVAPRSGFEDETPATKPTRELPADMDKTTLQFVEMIDGVYEIIHDPELLGNVIRSIMIELKSNPQYTKLIRDDDVRTWVRAMRENMGLARVKKVEAKARRSGSKTKSGSKAVDMDMMADLAELGIGDL